VLSIQNEEYIRENISLDIPDDIKRMMLELRHYDAKTVDDRIRYMELYDACDTAFSNWVFENRLWLRFFGSRYYWILGDDGLVSTPFKNDIIREYRNKCAICRLSVKDVLTIHHIIAKRHGGNTRSSNLIPVCPNCHKLLHIIQSDSEISDVLDAYIKKHKLRTNLEKYCAHLDCMYFTTPAVCEECNIDEWL